MEQNVLHGRQIDHVRYGLVQEHIVLVVGIEQRSQKMTETRAFGRRNPRHAQPRAVKPASNRRDGVGLGDNGGKLALDLLRNVALGALVVFGVSALVATRPSNTTATDVAAANAEPRKKPEPCGATLNEFYKLKTGMSYDQVERIIGCDGEIASQVGIAGINTAMVTWKSSNSFVGSMNATFQNGKLVAKAQFGLK